MRDLLSKLDKILNESALNPKDPKGDYKAKKQALADLEADPVAGKDPEISQAITQRKADLEKEAKSKGFDESFQIGDEFGISFSEDFEIATHIVDILEDGIVIELDDTAIEYLTLEGFTYEEGELVEGKKKGTHGKACWQGYRRVGTNDCTKISEYFFYDFPEKKDRGPRDSGQDELARREKSFRKHELAKDGRDYKDAMSPKSKSPFKGKYDIAGPKGKLPEDAVEESGLQYHTGVKKHGKEYMVKAAAAGREGASQKELGALKDKYSKAYKEDSAALPDIRGLGYDAQSLIFKLRRDVEEKRLEPTRQAVLSAARELAGDMDFAPELLVRQVLGQGVAEGQGTNQRQDWAFDPKLDRQYTTVYRIADRLNKKGVKYPEKNEEEIIKMIGDELPDWGYDRKEIRFMLNNDPHFVKGVFDALRKIEVERRKGVAEGMFGIDSRIKGKIQNITSDISDVPGMWDHKAQTFTSAGMEKLKSALNDNPKYIKYALNLNYKDYEAEGVAEEDLDEGKSYSRLPSDIIRKMFGVYQDASRGVEQHRDQEGAKRIYDALKTVAVEHNARSELESLLNAATRSAHMDFDMNPGDFVNWFPYVGEILAGLKKVHDEKEKESDFDVEKEDVEMEAKYQGREVPLGKKMAGDVKKSKVYVKNPQGNVVKVNFGDKKMKIKKSNPARRKSFRARHNCANPGPRHKARYWSCRSW